MRQTFVWDKNLEKVVPIGDRTDEAPPIITRDKYCYDRVDAHGETQHLLSKMEDAGKLKNPKTLAWANQLKKSLDKKPQQIVDYQKTGYPWSDK